MPVSRGYKYNLLIDAGCNHKEATEFSRNYTLTQLKTLPYFQTFLRGRRLYRAKALKAGKTIAQYKAGLADLYARKGWLTDKGTIDPWQMLKSYRKQSIASGDYVPPVTKGTHHKGDISKGDIQGQKNRARKKQHIARLQEQIKNYNQSIRTVKNEDTRQKFIHDRDNLKRELEQLR